MDQTGVEVLDVTPLPGEPGVPTHSAIRWEGTTVTSESFEGRKVVVIGGSSGMGLATAHQVVAGVARP